MHNCARNLSACIVNRSYGDFCFTKNKKIDFVVQLDDFIKYLYEDVDIILF